MTFVNRLFFFASAILILSCSSVEISSVELKYIDSAKIIIDKYYTYTDNRDFDSAESLYSDYFKNKLTSTELQEHLRNMQDIRGRSTDRALQGFGIKKVSESKNYVWLAYQVEYDSTQVTAIDTFWYFFQDHFSGKIDSVHFRSLK